MLCIFRFIFGIIACERIECGVFAVLQMEFFFDVSMTINGDYIGAGKLRGYIVRVIAMKIPLQTVRDLCISFIFIIVYRKLFHGLYIHQSAYTIVCVVVCCDWNRIIVFLRFGVVMAGIEQYCYARQKQEDAFIEFHVFIISLWISCVYRNEICFSPGFTYISPSEVSMIMGHFRLLSTGVTLVVGGSSWFLPTM